MSKRRNKNRGAENIVDTTGEEKINNALVKESIKFHDVRESLNVFTGDDTYSIAKWVDDLEEISEVCGWSNIELLIYSKRLVTGTAALYLRSKTGIKSWATLQQRLLNEFRSHLTYADIHT